MKASFLEALHEHIRPYLDDFQIMEVVTIPVDEGHCDEEVGDEIALWLHDHGLRARRVDRSCRSFVRFGFDDRDSAARLRELLIPSSV